MTFKHSKKWYFWMRNLMWAVGGIFAVVPALIAAIVNFPVMVTNNSKSTLSMFFVFALIIALVVVIWVVGKAFKNNTYVTVVVALAGITAFFIGIYNMEQETIYGFCWVAGCAAVGNLIACILFKVAATLDEQYKNCGEIFGEVSVK